MENKDILLAIVAIVAIVGIVIIVNHTLESGSYNVQPLQENIGQATLVVDSGEPFCTDSDKGIMPQAKGTVEFNDGKQEDSQTDFCRKMNSATLVEFYCDGNVKNSIDYECPNGCNDGACNQ
ncbi:hypothetical protein J4399_06215 [Candidatus Woesearchaeota archaeon]|nr:hypothetical protein [Candidatus Woesearchaeota archaeon]HIJ01043.1 hypothetical protein [Candidatus Woesearchaeota archaeon]HIJ14067.1 hypothetical protein [Candidatus Woesearchaeota archaeon]